MVNSLVLCYHAVSPAWDADLSVTPDRLERNVALLLNRGYRPVTFTQAVRAPEGEKVLAVTFDDAFQSVVRFAFPVLQRLDVPATVFVPTDYIGSERPMQWPGIDMWANGPSERELLPMTWPELRSLAAAGWEIGSHSGSHPRLTQLDDGTLEAELTRSKAVCESEIDRECSSVAYPYGDVDARVIAAAVNSGYTAGAALSSRLEMRGAMEWPRIGVYQVDGEARFRLKVSPALRLLRSSPGWALLEAARRRTG